MLKYERKVEIAKAAAHCKGILKTGIRSERGTQETNIIPEGDIYRLVIKSQLPTAEKFQKSDISVPE